jgi:hypothetical protein
MGVGGAVCLAYGTATHPPGPVEAAAAAMAAIGTGVPAPTGMPPSGRSSLPASAVHASTAYAAAGKGTPVLFTGGADGCIQVVELPLSLAAGAMGPAATTPTVVSRTISRTASMVAALRAQQVPQATPVGVAQPLHRAVAGAEAAAAGAAAASRRVFAAGYGGGLPALEACDVARAPTWRQARCGCCAGWRGGGGLVEALACLRPVAMPNFPVLTRRTCAHMRAPATPRAGCSTSSRCARRASPPTWASCARRWRSGAA